VQKFAYWTNSFSKPGDYDEIGEFLVCTKDVYVSSVCLNTAVTSGLPGRVSIVFYVERKSDVIFYMGIDTNTFENMMIAPELQLRAGDRMRYQVICVSVGAVSWRNRVTVNYQEAP